MTYLKHINPGLRFPAVVALFLLMVTSPSMATDPPETLDIIPSILPDTTTLQGKVVYIDFWASWCAPCRKSFPWMQSLYEKYHENGLEVIAINVDRDRESADKFLNENETSFTVIFDSAWKLAKQYGLEAMPSSYIYDRDGNLVSQHQGFREEKVGDVVESIQELMIKVTPE